MSDVTQTAEEWLPVPGYEGAYDVSDQGRIRSWHHKSPWILRLTPDGNGYLTFTAYIGGIRRRQAVHQIVARAFIGDRPAGLDIRHLDGNKLNNQVENLRYGTRSENARDAVRHGTNYFTRRTHCPQGHPYDEMNTRIGSNGGRICRQCIRDRRRRERASRLSV